MRTQRLLYDSAYWTVRRCSPILASIVPPVLRNVRQPATSSSTVPDVRTIDDRNKLFVHCLEHDGVMIALRIRCIFVEMARYAKQQSDSTSRVRNSVRTWMGWIFLIASPVLAVSVLEPNATVVQSSPTKVAEFRNTAQKAGLTKPNIFGEKIAVLTSSR